MTLEELLRLLQQQQAQPQPPVPAPAPVPGPQAAPGMSQQIIGGLGAMAPQSIFEILRSIIVAPPVEPLQPEIQQAMEADPNAYRQYMPEIAEKSWEQIERYAPAMPVAGIKGKPALRGKPDTLRVASEIATGKPRQLGKVLQGEEPVQPLVAEAKVAAPSAPAAASHPAFTQRKTGTPDTPVFQKFDEGKSTVGNIDLDPRLPFKPKTANEHVFVDYLAENGGLGDDYAASVVRWIRRQTGAGQHAVHVNQKTMLSIDISSNCPLNDGRTPCIYCYRYQPLAEAALLAKKTGKDISEVRVRGKNPPKQYEVAPYSAEIQQMPPDLVDFFNTQMGGLRVNSFGDWKPEMKPMFDAILADAKAKGLKLKVITGQPEMVALYGADPNVFFNLSTDFASDWQKRTFAGKPRMQALMEAGGRKQIGYKFSVEEAAALRNQYPGKIAVRYVAINRKDAINAVMDPRIDVVTLYHGLTDPKKLRAVWGVSNPYLEHPTQVGRKTVAPTLGPKGTQELASSFESPKAKSFAKNVKPGELALEAKGRMSKDEFEVLALEKLCCQTGNCSTCPAVCGLKPGRFRTELIDRKLEGEQGYAIREMIDYMTLLGIAGAGAALAKKYKEKQEWGHN